MRKRNAKPSAPPIGKEMCALDLPGGMIIPRTRTYPSQIQIFSVRGRPMTACHRLIRLASVIFALVGGLATLAASPPFESPSEADLAAQIDSLIEQKCREQQVEVAPIASDAEFLRRAHLDFIGTIPTVGEARAFLEDDLPQKRQRLIETLLERPDHATHLANLWRDDLLSTVENREILPEDAIRLLDGWLRARFLKNDGYDRLAAELITATGEQPNDRGAAIFISAHQTAAEGTPERLAASTARMFLGVQIDCAQCHDHFFAKWTQQDFWSFAANFTEVRNQNEAEPGQLPLLVDDATDVFVSIPGTKKALSPRYLGQAPPPTPSDSRRDALTQWLTAPDNPFFAQAAVNRLWAVLFGYGLVDPIDDMGDHNPPSHPELLQLLADDFATHHFDVRRTLRILANTKAYARSSRGNDSLNPRLFARKLVRPLSSEQLLASLRVAAGAVPLPTNDSTARQWANQLNGASSRVEYESGIPQALLLLNGDTVAELTDPEESRLVIAIAASPYFDRKERIETLFLAALSRNPSEEELARCTKYLEEADSATEGIADILWALLNSSEFALNH